MKLDVIIPTYRPDEEFISLIRSLYAQKLKPDNIYVLNTEEALFKEFDEKYSFTSEFPLVNVTHLSKEQFDHAGTRRRGVEMSNADIFVMMTQDAVPADEYVLEHLAGEIEKGACTAFARQLPKKECEITEEFIRNFNYPGESYIRSRKDIKTKGIKAFFLSDVCAAYDRATYDELGGFVERALFNEDMLYAARAVNEGKTIAYCAEAMVYHSHNYSGKEQFHRNFDNGVSQAQNKWLFEGISSEKEGVKLVKQTMQFLIKQKKAYLIPVFIHKCICRYAGFFLGKRYKRLPKFLVLKCTTNKAYFM